MSHVTNCKCGARRLGSQDSINTMCGMNTNIHHHHLIIVSLSQFSLISILKQSSVCICTSALKHIHTDRQGEKQMDEIHTRTHKRTTTYVCSDCGNHSERSNLPCAASCPGNKQISGNSSLFAGISMMFLQFPWWNLSKMQFWYQEKVFDQGACLEIGLAATVEKREASASRLLLHMLYCASVQPRLLSSICMHLA